MSEQQRVTLPIQLDVSSNEEALFVNHASVVFDGASYTLRLFQVLPPVALDEDHLPQAVRGRHVVTLAISAASMPAIFDSLRSVVEQQLADERGES